MSRQKVTKLVKDLRILAIIGMLLVVTGVTGISQDADAASEGAQLYTQVSFTRGTPEVHVVSLTQDQVYSQREAGSIIAARTQYHVQAEPERDALRVQQWALDRMNVDEAHASGYDGTGIAVAVVDSGIEAHPELVGRVQASRDFVGGDSYAKFHGTEMAGIISARTGDGTGMEGIAPQASLIDARVCTQTCWNDNVAAGIIWSVNQGAKIINLSLEGGHDAALQAIVNWAVDQGVLVVAAAGNAGCDPDIVAACDAENETMLFPGAGTKALAVTATGEGDISPPFTSYGHEASLAAPGVGIVTTSTSNYTNVDGTSPAAANVSGTAALVLQADPELTPNGVQAILQATAQQPTAPLLHRVWAQGHETQQDDLIPQRWLAGAGIVDTGAAVALAHKLHMAGETGTGPTAIAGDSTIEVSWDSVPGAVRYDVIVDNGPDILSTSSTETAVVGLTNEADYAVRVRAYDSSNTLTTESAPILVTPHQANTLPSVVVTHGGESVYSLTATLDGNTSVPPGTSLRLYRVGVGFVAASTSFDDLSAEFGWSFDDEPTADFYITLVDQTGMEGPASNVFTVAIADVALGTPTNVRVTTGDSSVTISWDPVAGAVSYNVLEGGQWAVETASPVTVTGLENGRNYFAQVYAKDDNNANTEVASFAGDRLMYTPLAPAPQAVDDLAAVATADGIFLTWTPDPYATGYDIYSDSGRSFGGGVDGQVTDLSVPGYALTPGQTYHYTAYAYHNYSNGYSQFSSVSNDASALFTYAIASAPQNVAVSSGNQQAVVSFAAPAYDGGSAITGYTVTAQPSGHTSSSTISPVTMNGLTNGIAYRFTVTATNGAGTSAASAPSEPVTPHTVPDSPAHVTAVPADQAAVVSFAAPANNGGAAITGYTVTAHPSGQQVEVSSSPAILSGLTNNTVYRFTVAATNAAGRGEESPLSAALTVGGVPGRVRHVVAKATSGKATISFSAPANTDGPAITGYTACVLRGTNQRCVSSETSPVTVRGLETTGEYTAVVRAENAAGDGPFSAAVAVTMMPGTSNDTVPSVPPSVAPPAAGEPDLPACCIAAPLLPMVGTHITAGPADDELTAQSHVDNTGNDQQQATPSQERKQRAGPTMIGSGHKDGKAELLLAELGTIALAAVGWRLMRRRRSHPSKRHQQGG